VKNLLLSLLVVLATLAACREKEVAVVPPQASPTRTATMSIVVTDTPTALEQLIATAEQSGGRVTAARVWREDGRMRATLTVRVPSQRLTETLSAVRKLASEVEGETIAEE
jgi:predicted small lipoprotein YifL